MKLGKKIFEHGLGRPIANASFAMMHWQVRTIEKRGVEMMHTARPFSYYRKVFYRGASEHTVLKHLEGKRIADVGCGYTPYADDSMFRACHNAGVEFYGVDPLIDQDISFGLKDRLLAKALGSTGRFSTKPPGLDKALPALAQDLPFEDQSVDEILCSYLLFVWIEKESDLADILTEFSRVLKPGGVIKLYPLYEWRFVRLSNAKLLSTLAPYEITQRFVHGGVDLRVTPSMLTELVKTPTS